MSGPAKSGSKPTRKRADLRAPTRENFGPGAISLAGMTIRVVTRYFAKYTLEILAAPAERRGLAFRWTAEVRDEFTGVVVVPGVVVVVEDLEVEYARDAVWKALGAAVGDLTNVVLVEDIELDGLGLTHRIPGSAVYRP